MGCTPSATKSSVVPPNRGFRPAKQDNAKNSNVFIQEKVYIFGGSKILEFDTKAMKISAVNQDPKLILATGTQCEYIRSMNKIATLGGLIGGKCKDDGYLFSPPDFTKFEQLPKYPKPINNTTLCEIDGVLYAIGGETDGGDPNGLLTDVCCLTLKPTIGKEWQKVCDLKMRRRNANVVVSLGTIFVFGGYNGSNLRTTQIETIDIKTKIVTVQPYRLPLGVEGTRMCWHGSDILLIGGKKIGDTSESNILLLDLEKKAIMSMRDLREPRAYPIVIPIKIDEVVVIGGGGKGKPTCEKRSWSPVTQDYEFTPCQVQGSELIEDASNYDTALPTFMNSYGTEEHFPELSNKSTFIFGNEIDCFFIEMPEDLIAVFNPSPLTLQQKTGQSCIRADQNTIFMVGGTNTTKTLLSTKAYKFTIDKKEVKELAKLNEARYQSTLVQAGIEIFAIGGNGKNGAILNSVEKLNTTKDAEKWDILKPMKFARCGAAAWACNGKIYVVGGTSGAGKNVAESEVYDIKTGEWSTLALPNDQPLAGTGVCEVGDDVYLFGGMSGTGVPSGSIFKVSKSNPTKLVSAGTMKNPRGRSFVFKSGKHIVVIGGSDRPLMEVFDVAPTGLTAVAGFEAKSSFFFTGLLNHTTDVKLEACSFA